MHACTMLRSVCERSPGASQGGPPAPSSASHPAVSRPELAAMMGMSSVLPWKRGSCH